MLNRGPFKDKVTSNYILEENMNLKKGGKIVYNQKYHQYLDYGRTKYALPQD